MCRRFSRGHVACDEETVLALSLVPRHQDDARLRRADGSTSVVREDLSGDDRIEAVEPRQHLEAVAGLDDVSMADLDDARGPLRRPRESGAVRLELLDEPRLALRIERAHRREEDEHGAHVAPRRCRIVVLTRFDGDSDVPARGAPAQHRRGDRALEADDGRDGQRACEAETLSRTPDAGERPRGARGGVQIEEGEGGAWGRGGGLRVLFLEREEGVEELAVLPIVLREGACGRPQETFEGGGVPAAVQVPCEEADASGERLAVAGECHDAAAQRVTGVLEPLEELDGGEDT